MMALGLLGCKKDPCKDVTCANDGVCFEGKCICPDGFEGANCETLQQETFDGNYAVSETCNLGNFDYEVQIITDSSDVHAVAIFNLVDLGLPVRATVTGNEIDIYKQVILDDTIFGSGLFADSLLTIDYELIPDSGAVLTCTVSGMLVE